MAEQLSAGGKNEARAAYIDQLNKEAALYPSIPDVEVRFDFSYTLQLESKTINHEITTVPQAAANTALAPFRAMRSIKERLMGHASSATKPFRVLDGVHGVLRPGTVTLLLAPPGHGKTSFLKALSGRLPFSKLQGSLSYSGIPADQLQANGVYLRLLSQYTDQLDVHLPYLTVRETAQFAYENSTVHPSMLREADPSGMLEREAANRVERVIQLLSLGNCADTVVGNELLRGISGGEKKRVTVAESLVSNARLFCMDEISTGLDSSVTYDIMASLREYARAMRATVVVSLLQPTPEVYGLFDDVILMREGATVYHGPREALPGYLEGLGFHPPQALTSVAAGGPEGSSTPAASVDTADWLTELLTHPAKTAAAGAAKVAKLVTSASSGMGTPEASSLSLTSLAAAGSETEAAAAPSGGKPAPPTTTATLAAAWRASELCKSRLAPSTAEGTAAPSLELRSQFAKAQYGRPYPRSPWTHFGSLLKRQVDITLRNKLFVTARVASAIVISLVLGSVWWRLSPEAGLAKFGLLLFAALQIAFANFSEVPFAVENKYNAYKAISSGMYPPMAYVLASSLVHIPIALAETAIFSIVLYFMAGLVESASQWFYFYGLLTLVNMAMASMFRVFAYALKDLEAAQTAPGPLISIQVIFAGFLITYAKMGWLQFMYWVSIFAWALKGLALNEFKASLYDTQVPDPAAAAIYFATHPGATQADVPALCADGTLPCTRRGDIFLSQLDLTTDTRWQWASLGFIAGFVVLMTLLGGWVLAAVRIERNIGTSRTKDVVDASEAEAAGDAVPVAVKATNAVSTSQSSTPLPTSPSTASLTDATSPVPVTLPVTPLSSSSVVPVDVKAASGGVVPPQSNPMHSAPAPPASASSVLPFEPMTVAWRNIEYTVNLPKQLGGGTKQLLRGVSGYAEPGKLLALMGASGAGKTTLLDVLAGRKNSGVMKGSITLNGHPKEPLSFARLTAYVEQQDIHSSFATVRESLEFSAALRLPSSVPAATRRAFVSEVLDLLELRPIADRKVGDVGAADGLSPGQRKILTIAVELCANAPILFLDEPTSGLDSRAAQLVMRVVRRIADTGRTVITTIHQPSAELFFMMDSLLLLQKGGWTAYYGPIGHHGRTMVQYLQRLPGVTPCPRRMNPASWMLDALSGSDSSGGHLPATAGAVADGGGHGHGTASTAEAHTWSVTHDSRHEPVAMSPLPDTPSVDATPASAADLVKPAAPSALSDVSGSSTAAQGIPGPLLQATLLASPEWASCLAKVEAYSTPAPGSMPYAFTSQYATSWPHQLGCLLQRTWRSYMRNVPYNYTRWTALLGLVLLFGTIWYQLEADDIGGVQSLVSVIFMTSLSLAYFLVELPWLAWICLTVVPIVYFMVGFEPTAGAFFFYLLTVWVLTILMTSLGQLAAACIATVEVAQGVLSVFIPLLFVFGGLFLPGPSIPIGWRWAHYIDPIKHVITALVPPQFYRGDCTPHVDCPRIMTFDAGSNAFVAVDTFDYVQNYYGLEYAQRWNALGYLVVYIAGFQLFHFLAVRFISHVKR